MDNTKKMSSVHQGNNIRFFRAGRMLGQNELGEKIGMTQSGVAKLEDRPTIEEDILERCSKALGISTDVLKEFEPEKLLNNITYNIEKVENNNGSSCNPYGGNFSENTFNPIEKLTELYERMLKAEQEKVTMLEKMVAESNQKK